MEIAYKVLSVYYPYIIGKASGRAQSPIIIPCLKHDQIAQLLIQSTNFFAEEPAFLRLNGRFFIVGDLHGNIVDLVRIIKYVGLPTQEKNIIFLGDYVDRGEFSMEVVIFLVALKMIYPKSVYLLRGNHEFGHLNSTYGFKDIIKRAYSEEIYDLFNRLFANLPIAALIGNHTFLVHGGISEQLVDLSQLDAIKKPSNDFARTPYRKLVMDLMWSDPSPEYSGYGPTNRGEGHFFGEKALSDFLERNQLVRVIRGHQFVPRGVEQFASNLYTVFTSTRYVADVENKSGLIEINAKAILTAYSFPQNIVFQRRNAHFVLIDDVEIPLELVKSTAVSPSSSYAKQFSMLSENVLPTATESTTTHQSNSNSHVFKSMSSLPNASNYISAQTSFPSLGQQFPILGQHQNVIDQDQDNQIDHQQLQNDDGKNTSVSKATSQGLLPSLKVPMEIAGNGAFGGRVTKFTRKYDNYPLKKQMQSANRRSLII